MSDLGFVYAKHVQQNYWFPSRSLVITWVIYVLVIWALAVFVGKFVAPARSWVAFPRTPVEVLSTWDGSYYTAIASKGYSVEGTERRRFAFFPLLPVVARLLGGSTGASLAGILLGQVCMLASMILLGRLAYGNRPVPLYLQPGFWLLVTPLGFFFFVFYTESLFLFLTLLMVVAWQKDWLRIAGTVGLLVGLTRPTAILLSVPFLWDAMRRFQRGERWFGILMCAAAPCIGVGLYMSIVGYIMGDPFGYFAIQKGFGQYWRFPFLPLIRSSGGFLFDLLQGRIRSAEQIFRLFSSISTLILIIWGWRRCDRVFLIYLIASMLFIHSQEPHRSTARYELVLFPVYLLLPQMIIGHPRMAYTISGLLLLIQFKFFIDHISWRWVA